MANVGIIEKRNTKAELETQTSIQAELVYSTDTGEFGWQDPAGSFVWQTFSFSNIGDNGPDGPGSNGDIYFEKRKEPTLKEAKNEITFLFEENSQYKSWTYMDFKGITKGEGTISSNIVFVKIELRRGDYLVVFAAAEPVEYIYMNGMTLKVPRWEAVDGAFFFEINSGFVEPDIVAFLATVESITIANYMEIDLSYTFLQEMRVWVYYEDKWNVKNTIFMNESERDTSDDPTGTLYLQF